MTTSVAPAVTLQEPMLRWTARAHSIAEVEKELARIWAQQDLTADIEGAPGRHIAARTSVMNLVVIARRPEVAAKTASTIQTLVGRHPSRTIVVQSADPDGPSWIDARVEAHCILPRADAPETCAETIHLTAGGESGRHLSAIVTPLLIHDLPVAVWWPEQAPFTSKPALDLLAGADRLIVDGSSWSGDGLTQLRDMARLLDTTRLAISDFALVRQSRWREAIASVFDDPDFLPYLRSVRRVAVTYATHDETGAPESTNIVKPVYHVAWLASRLGWHVRTPLHAIAEKGAAAATARGRGHVTGRPVVGRGLAATMTDGKGEIAVVVRPLLSPMPAGTTLRVELLAERRGSELRADVTAEAETVRARVWLDGVEALDRAFLAARRNDVDLLAEAIEAGGRDPVAMGAIHAAARLVDHGTHHAHPADADATSSAAEPG